MHDQNTYPRPRSPVESTSGQEPPGPKITTAAETAKDTVADEARTVGRTAKHEAGAVVDVARLIRGSSDTDREGGTIPPSPERRLSGRRDVAAA